MLRLRHHHAGGHHELIELTICESDLSLSSPLYDSGPYGGVRGEGKTEDQDSDPLTKLPLGQSQLPGWSRLGPICSAGMDLQMPRAPPMQDCGGKTSTSSLLFNSFFHLLISSSLIIFRFQRNYLERYLRTGCVHVLHQMLST